MKRRAIKFSVDEDQKQRIDAYAKEKGFDKPSNLARMALFNYMARNPSRRGKKPQCATALQSESMSGDTTEQKRVL